MADVSFRTDGVKQKALKILVIGDMHVGKSSLLLRFCRNAFNPNMRATIGVDYLLKTLTIDQVDYLFQIWDTGTRVSVFFVCFCFFTFYIKHEYFTWHFCSGARAVPRDHDIVLPNCRRRYPRLRLHRMFASPCQLGAACGLRPAKRLVASRSPTRVPIRSQA
jgi:hypothetical protein